MRQVNIYVEGTSDRIFLANYLAVVLGFELDVEVGKSEKSRQYYFRKEDTEGEIRLLNGWKTLFDPNFEADLEMDDEDGILSLVLVDADFPEDGGFSKRTQAVADLSYQQLFEAFILPNGAQDGYIETLFEHIVTPACKPILACFLAQEVCIKEKAVPASIQLCLDKEKNLIKKQMDQFRNRLDNKTKGQHVALGKGFQDADIWNLHDTYLDPLKDFLTQHLLPESST